MKDSGFRRWGWGATPWFGVTPIIWQDFCQRLHENERNWTERRRVFLVPPLGSANDFDKRHRR